MRMGHHSPKGVPNIVGRANGAADCTTTITWLLFNKRGLSWGEIPDPELRKDEHATQHLHVGIMTTISIKRGHVFRHLVNSIREQSV